MKRTGLLFLVAIAALALLPDVASAKIPPFTVEASPKDPTAGDVVRLTVRFWDDMGHTDPARWPEMRLLGDVLWAHPAGSSEEAVPLDIRLVRPGVYRGELTVSSPGTWVLCTWEPRCAGGSSMAGYPDRIELEVASSAPDPVDAVVGGTSTEPAASRLPVPVLALAGFVGAAAALVGRSARSRRT